MISQQLGSMPILISFIPDGTIALSPMASFKGIVDGVAVFTMDGYSIAGEQYEYNLAIEYKDEPAMVEYLKSLNLVQPTKEEIIRAMSSFRNPFGF